jgi:hypothetical protein
MIGAIMAYEHIIKFRVTAEMHDALAALAKRRDSDICKSLRELLARELYRSQGWMEELRERVLFLVIAMDGLLSEHPNRELRTTILNAWEKRMAEEASHAA